LFHSKKGRFKLSRYKLTINTKVADIFDSQQRRLLSAIRYYAYIFPENTGGKD